MNRSEPIIREGNTDDLEELQQLFVYTLTTICKKDYNEEQIIAWTSSIENKQRWLDILTKQYIIVAQDKDKIIGFASLDNGNYIDLFYVHKDYLRQGVGKKLYAGLEREAVKHKKKTLHSDVSKTARPFFEKKGFSIVAKQAVVRQGVELMNYKMKKDLN